MTEPRKIRVATASLAGCFGCHMALLDIDERLIELMERVEFDRSPLTDIKHSATAATWGSSKAVAATRKTSTFSGSSGAIAMC
jgi:hypothetical protein